MPSTCACSAPTWSPCTSACCPAAQRALPRPAHCRNHGCSTTRWPRRPHDAPPRSLDWCPIASLLSRARHVVAGAAVAARVVSRTLELGVAERAEQVLAVLGVLAEVGYDRIRSDVPELERAEAARMQLAPVRVEV